MTDQDRVETLRQSRKRFWWTIQGELLFGEAFKKIARDGQTVTAYLLILARQTLPPNRKERIRMEKAGTWPPKDTSFSFPLREARYHGLTEKGLAAGLRRLHEVGIIDRIRTGSSRKGDFSLYVLSERWRGFGKPTFNAVPWSRTLTEEENKIRKEQEKKRRDPRGKFIRRRGRTFLVAAISAVKESSLAADSAVKAKPLAAEIAVNSTLNALVVAAEIAVLLSLPSLDVNPGRSKKGGKKDRTSNSRAKTNFGPIQCNAIPRWTDKEQVVELCDALLLDVKNNTMDCMRIKEGTQNVH